MAPRRGCPEPFLLLGGLLATLAGCSAAPGDSCSAARQQASIVNGSHEPHEFPLEAERRGAFGIVSPAVDAPLEAFCSAVVIAPGWVLTAAHCWVDQALWFSVEPDDPTSFSKVRHALSHAELDLALLEVETPTNVVPFPVARPEDEPALLGAAVELAGFGLDENTKVGSLRFAREAVVDVTEQLLRVSADGASGACVGDSGGPLLMRGLDGRVRIFGVLSQGSLGCLGEDDYTRVATSTSWIEAVVGPDASNAPEGCDGLDASGVCARNQAFFCELGRVQTVTCSPGEICGWTEADTGYRCITPPPDACGR